MIVLQAKKKYPFRDRAPEWILSTGLLIWGFSIHLFPQVFESNAFIPLLSIMSAEAWATSTILLGSIRLMALIINGAWRPTAHLRAIGSVLGIIIWSSLFIISLMNASERASGIASYGMLLAFDFMALWWAAGDAKLVDQLAKSKKE